VNRAVLPYLNIEPVCRKWVLIVHFSIGLARVQWHPHWSTLIQNCQKLLNPWPTHPSFPNQASNSNYNTPEASSSSIAVSSFSIYLLASMLPLSLGLLSLFHPRRSTQFHTQAAFSPLPFALTLALYMFWHLAGGLQCKGGAAQQRLAGT